MQGVDVIGGSNRVARKGCHARQFGSPGPISRQSLAWSASALPKIDAGHGPQGRPAFPVSTPVGRSVCTEILQFNKEALNIYITNNPLSIYIKIS
jgi:hypothetical protein